MAIRAAIFDLDGTLLDSTGIWRQIDEIFLGRRGFDVPADYFEAVSSMNLQQGAEYTKARFSLSDTHEAIIAEWHEMALHAYAETIPLKPGAAQILRKLSAQGIRLALATASDPAYYIPALRRCGVLDLFDVCVHARPGLYKGSAAFYLHCAAELDVCPEECVVFEDVYTGIRSAKEAGMYAVAVADPHSAARQAEIKELADRFLDSFEDLLESMDCGPV